MSASPIILSTDEPDPVITLGGFMGRDPVLSTDELASLVNEGAVRFFLIPDRERMQEMMAEREAEGGTSSPQKEGGPLQGFPGRGGDFLQNDSTNWVQDNCEQVPQELWQSSSDQGGGGPGMMRAQALYDCSTEGK
jgi:hypothetical protein